MDEFEYLKIQLEEIKIATGNFSDSVIIGCGGFGKVYAGEVSHSKGRNMVAIKRLDRKFGQGDSEFWKEIMMLSRYTHKNIISLLGFCDEDDEKILVYEHASNGSLDRHLNSTSLGWTQRIKICLDAANGLSYLHDHKGSQQRILHRDIKSANILLEHNWNAKVSDMGLSKLGPANQLHSNFYTNIVGTPGYCDPQYMMTYMLTKESDVYSFGVVLFEVLTGKLCFKVDSNNQLHILVPMWKQSYLNKKLDEIIFNDLIPSMDKTSLEAFVDIAFQCVQESREQRPKISLVVKELETALKFQEHYEMKMLKKYDNEDINKDVETTSTDRDFEDLISKGKRIVVNTGKTAIIEDDDKDQETSSVPGSYGDIRSHTMQKCLKLKGWFSTPSRRVMSTHPSSKTFSCNIPLSFRKVLTPNVCESGAHHLFSKAFRARGLLKSIFDVMLRTQPKVLECLKNLSQTSFACGQFAKTNVAHWKTLQFNTGSTTPFIIACGANSDMELVIKADYRVQEPKGGEIIRVVPRPSVLENMSLNGIKEVFSKLPEAVSLLALATTTDETRALYSELYMTMTMTVLELGNLVA